MSRSPAVLVIDDEPSIRLVCRVNLELEGYRVLEASTGAEARLALDRDDVDVLVLDVRLGVESGVALLRSLRLQGCAVPAILLTGSADAVKPDGLDALVVAKPFALEELTDAVARLAARPGAGPVDSAS